MIEQTTTTGGKVSYRYNARGQIRTVEYDAVGRITKWTDEISSRAYQYDDNDNVLSVTDSVAGKVSFSYDKLDRVLTYIDGQGSKLSYTYDVVGNLTTLIYPDNKQVKYAYDARGALISVTDWANRVTRYSYDANGRLIKEERPNKTISTKRYDVAGRLIEVQDVDSSGKVIVSFNYRYDAAGNIVEEQMSPEPDISAVQSMAMEYGIGNSLTKVGTQTTSLDLDGNLLQAPLNGTLTNFEYNQRNQLVKAATLEYGYDALGYRDAVIEKGKTTRYVLNPIPKLHQALMKIAPDGTKTFYVYGLGLIGEETNGKYLSYHFDYRGSTVALTASDAQVVNRFAYEPYGGLLGREALLQGTSFLFNGRYGVMTDSNGLYQMRARFYHPELRRFINQGPVFLGTLDDSQSLNRFAYVNGKPVNAIDPWGLECINVKDLVNIKSSNKSPSNSANDRFRIFSRHCFTNKQLSLLEDSRDFTDSVYEAAGLYVSYTNSCPPSDHMEYPPPTAKPLIPPEPMPDWMWYSIYFSLWLGGSSADIPEPPLLEPSNTKKVQLPPRLPTPISR